MTMLSTEQLELITTAVDGELSAMETRAFRRLLESSAEARALFAKLKADSERIQTLPQTAPPADLHAKVLARIAATTPAPQRPKPTRSSAAKHPAQHSQPAPKSAPEPRESPYRRTPAWVPAALAASLLLGITVGSFAFFRGEREPKHMTGQHPWAHSLPAPQGRPTAVPSPSAIAPRELPPANPDSVARVNVVPIPEPHPATPEPLATAPEPRPAKRDLIASPLLPKLPPFDLIQIQLPFLRTVAEFDREDTRQELTDELTRGGFAFRFDLFVRDPARGVEVLQLAAKAGGVTLYEDAATLDKLKKRQAQAVVIYLECLTPAELTDLFAKVCTEDMKFSPRVCDSLHVMPIIRADEMELKVVLGVDVGLYKRPRAGGTGGTGGNSGTGRTSGTGQGGNLFLDKTGTPKPVSAGTIDTVTKSLTTPPAKRVEKPAVLMTWQTTHPSIGRTMPSMSNELKQFLAQRGDRKPNALPVIIVIRQEK